ncbi:MULTISPECIES: MBL fold metallo-hydrolase [unclassified Paracoccus (in: a-proteobacteria)]|uniref:MBL fold metallo-hydrolase n=1 Tax=unclassified Paracoccus (in: a-proteobacteria) TaxID=2688777 RepID=UPI0012B36DCC|nr:MULTISPECIES: MBL fold metallo-hydrolase [unclassified Paracoccus (in: a-proteobacteria)]UXU76636.1 MBL fold metallo-hydrolase [Paracoccus sp. SMMA_5]UXU82524.1 MBL fold metallo-hydrolase [Paracoccus sp. SMMA_5_TC]
MTKPFASSADTEAKTDTLEILAEGVYALTAEGDPNVGAVEGEDFVVAIESRATPAASRDWLRILRSQTDKPVRYLILTHYHAVRVLGASAFDAQDIIMSTASRDLVAERGEQDWKSEFGRMPRLARNAEEVPGLTWPTLTFDSEYDIELGGDRGSLQLRFLGRGHTGGDIVVWHDKSRTLYAGDLVESRAALYTGDAYHFDWAGKTLDNVKAWRAENLVGGRGAVSRGLAETDAAIEQTRKFLNGMIENVGRVHKAGGDLKAAFEATRDALAPEFGAWPIFEHCLPFDVQRLWDEFDGIEHPRIWTAERDREVWARLQG